jgi:hypothetical protein
MGRKWTTGAQLSTSHSSPGALTLEGMRRRVEAVAKLIELDFLILGGHELPEIFDGFSGPDRPVRDVYLWYNTLSDIAGMEESDLVVNWRGEKSRGWGGWSEQGADVRETFRFVCPNNPAPRRKTLARLRELMARYPFTGVFIDKIRFPSPANGFDELLCCFCEHCRRAARAIDLDLEAVRRIVADGTINPVTSATSPGIGGAWLDDLLAANPLLARFHRFRCDSITGLVAEAYDEIRQLGRSVAFDLFSPGLASLVGQDYRALSRYCVWAKPMTYRVAEGPAGLRLEIPALADGIARHFKIPEAQISAWAAAHISGFDRSALSQTRREAVPIGLITEEIAAAVAAMHPVPVYFGLELVRHPGVIDITPALVEAMVKAGRAADAAGLVISWDLMHAPMEGIAALAAATKDLR